MYFRPKFDQKVNVNGIPNTCYHITPTRLVNKILSQGLKPKDYGRTSNHTERVFLSILEVKTPSFREGMKPLFYKFTIFF